MIPWGVGKLYILSMYLLAGYVLVGGSYALLADLTVTGLNIVFALGLLVSAILFVPAIMSTDSGSSMASSIFIATVFSYPVVYLVSLVSSRWVPFVAENEVLALFVAALPLINVLVFISLILILLIKESR